ncbi:thiolase [Stutzerimonas xanthomarina]|jgi:acetyl-CoA acetyltransferase|uniref:Thiolase n=1 Tax=Stutzerimonas xanthomarina TaxID=271420 RepID=A0A3R8UGB3_9GAMM|nr:MULTISPECIES: thiolase [Stutzerimonas]MCW8158361.1 thiolase [Stutzerimonas stutzeri]RRV13480.1 thiolase [Stutzerimonas xanthomarina]
MESFPRGRAAIVGAATYGMGESPGLRSLDLASRAALLALQDANLKLGDVDALFVCTPDDALSGLSAAEYLGIQPRFTENNRTGGSAFHSHVIAASLMLEAGYCDTALIMYGSNQRTASGGLVSMRLPSPYEKPYKPLTPLSSYALAAARHMHEYGTTREHLAEVAVAARNWAKLNPDAFARGDLTIEDCLKARMVSDPLSVRDCCLVTDGAAAIVLTRADRAKDLNAQPIYVLGAAAATWYSGVDQATDLTVTAARESGERAFAIAGLKPADIDVVQLYDAFTINTILFLEDLGFCPKGEGGPFVSGGNIGPGGSLPVNTNGGGLSCCHPGMYGLFTMVESCMQLRGQAGARQVADARLALAHANGGTLSSQATMILGTADCL